MPERMDAAKLVARDTMPFRAALTTPVIADQAALAPDETAFQAPCMPERMDAAKLVARDTMPLKALETVLLMAFHFSCAHFAMLPQRPEKKLFTSCQLEMT